MNQSARREIQAAVNFYFIFEHFIKKNDREKIKKIKLGRGSQAVDKESIFHFIKYLCNKNFSNEKTGKKAECFSKMRVKLQIRRGSKRTDLVSEIGKARSAD